MFKIFGKKNKENRPDENARFHKIFRLLALALILFVAYSLYYRPVDKVEDSGQLKKCILDEDKLNEKVKQAFNKMNENPEYKRMKEFVDLVDSKIKNEKGGIYNAPNGTIIFIPSEALKDKNSKFLIEDGDQKFQVTR